MNRCFVAVDIQDISHATITEGPTYYDEFYYMCALVNFKFVLFA